MQPPDPSRKRKQRLELLSFLAVPLVYGWPWIHHVVTGTVQVAVPAGWSVRSVVSEEGPVPCTPWRAGARCRMWGEQTLVAKVVSPDGQEHNVECAFYGVTLLAIRSAPGAKAECRSELLGMWVPWQ